MKNLNLKQIIKPTLCLFIICLLITLLLAATNNLTSQKIQQQAVKKQEDSCKLVFENAQSFQEETYSDITYFKALDNDNNTLGYVLTTKSNGYGGEIKVMTGIDNNKNVTGIVILSQNETPGLGSNAEKESFRSQFKQSIPNNGFNVVKSTPSGGEIEALTGATITSKAVTKAVNLAVEDFYKISQKEHS